MQQVAFRPRARRSAMACGMLLALAAALALGGSPARAAAAEVYGVVTGAAGRPLPGALVELYRYGVGLVQETTAAAGGAFRLPLAAGTGVYWLRAWAPGHAVAEQAWVPGQSGPIAHLQLRPLDGRVAGVVIDTNGRAVAGAAVELVHKEQGVTAAATSDADGRFQLPARAAAAGAYAVRVLAAGWQPYQADLPDVPGGGGAAVTVELAPATGRVTGVVVAGATGAPVPGAGVLLVRLDGGDAAGPGGAGAAAPSPAAGPAGAAVLAEATTGADGQYELTFPAAAGATYAVRAATAGFVAAGSPAFLLDRHGRRDLAGGERLALAGRYAGLQGRVTGSAGSPAAKLEVWLERQGSGIAAMAVTGPDGDFAFAGVAAVPGASYRVRAVPTESGDRTADTGWLTLTPGRTATVALALPAGTRSSYGRGAIRGMVTLPDGAPVADATVELLREGVGKVAGTTTAADGSYRFTDVDANAGSFGFGTEPANGYILRVTRAGFTATAVVTAPVPAGGVDVQHRRETAADLVLFPATALLSGRVLDDGGHPVAGALIRLLPEGSGQQLQTLSGASGQFRINAPAPEQYRVQATAHGYRAGVPAAAGAWPLALAPGQESALDLVLRRATAGLAGVVTDGRGRGVAGARVMVWTPDGEPAAAMTGPMGEYAFAALPADWPVAVTAAGAGHSSPLMAGAAGSGLAPAGALAPGALRRLDLALRPADAAISGLVVDAGGAPLAGVRVELLREGEGSVGFVMTGPSGLYRFDKVAAGPAARYLVRPHLPGHAFRVAGSQAPPPLFGVAAGEVQHVHLQLQPLAP